MVDDTEKIILQSVLCACVKYLGGRRCLQMNLQEAIGNVLRPYCCIVGASVRGCDALIG